MLPSFGSHDAAAADIHSKYAAEKLREISELFRVIEEVCFNEIYT